MAKRINEDHIAYPPRGLSRPFAARYIGVSTSKFDQMVSDGRMPEPIRIDSRKVWDRLKIDAAFEALSDADENDGDYDTWASVSAERIDLDKAKKEVSEFTKYAQSIEGRSTIAEGYLWPWDEWVDHIKSKPLNNREVVLLLNLLEFGDRVVDLDELWTSGLNTINRLEGRGFIEVIDPKPNRYSSIKLTSEGLSQASNLKSGTG